MNKRRLLKLADLLEADAKNKKGVKFDLSSWGHTNGGDEAPFHSCGTTACAVGLAVVSGAFKRSGLKNLFVGDGTICPSYNGKSDWPATRDFFGLSIDESHYLFSEDHYPAEKSQGAIGERYVAKRIRDFVAGKISA